MLRCCERCFEHIVKKNVESATLWAELCDDSCADTFFACSCDNVDFFRTLEHENYIVTTEALDPNFLSVKLCGIEPYSNLVCIRTDIHY